MKDFLCSRTCDEPSCDRTSGRFSHHHASSCDSSRSLPVILTDARQKSALVQWHGRADPAGRRAPGHDEPELLGGFRVHSGLNAADLERRLWEHGARRRSALNATEPRAITLNAVCGMRPRLQPVQWPAKASWLVQAQRRWDRPHRSLILAIAVR